MRLRADKIAGSLMTEAFFAVGAMLVALSAAMVVAVAITAAFIAWRDWQRERGSSNCDAGPGHRLDGVGQHLQPRV